MTSNGQYYKLNVNLKIEYLATSRLASDYYPIFNSSKVTLLKQTQKETLYFENAPSI